MRFPALVLLASLAALGSAQTVQLRYDPPVGATRSYTMKMSMSMTMAGAPGGKPFSFAQTSPMKIRVVSRTADTTTIETTTGPFKQSASNSMPKTPQATKPVVGRVTMDRSGTPKGAAGAGMAAGMMNAMGGSFQGVMLPKKPVRVGESWSQTIDMGKMMKAAGPMRMNGKMPLTYRLVSLANGVATVAMTSKANLAMDMGGRSIKTAMDMRGTILLEAATGLTKSMTTTTDSTTQMPGMGAMRQHMTMSMK